MFKRLHCVIQNTFQHPLSCRQNANLCHRHFLYERLSLVLGYCYIQTVCVCVWFAFFFERESFSLHLHMSATSVKWKAICSRGCKLSLHLGKMQTQKLTKNQHVKQNMLSTCELFTNSKPSLSIVTEQRSSSVKSTHRGTIAFVFWDHNASRLQDPNQACTPWTQIQAWINPV